MVARSCGSVDLSILPIRGVTPGYPVPVLGVFARIFWVAPLHSISQMRAIRGSHGVEELRVMAKGVGGSGEVTLGLER